MYQKRVFFDVGTIGLDGSCVDLYSLEIICRDGGKNFFRENWKRKMLFNCCKYLKELTKKIVGSFLSM